MSDPTITKFHDRLAEIRSESDRLRSRIDRANEQLSKLERDEEVIVAALQAIGEEVPRVSSEAVADAGARRRAGGKLRAIDAALMVVEPGESVSHKDVAERIEMLSIDFKSSNLSNALATAMARSKQFRKAGRGVFMRIGGRESADKVTHSDKTGSSEPQHPRPERFNPFRSRSAEQPPDPLD